ncbi:MAG: LytTR family DNA-binding domain-containing protein [Vicinamibacterales bacterium]
MSTSTSVDGLAPDLPGTAGAGSPAWHRLAAGSALFLLVGAFALAATIYVRTTLAGVESRFLAVWLWQAGAWLPWFLLVPSLTWVVRAKRCWGVAVRPSHHAAASVLVAGLSTLWFYGLSSRLSPFLDAPQTRFGVFPWFFVFWAFCSLLGYWATVGVASMQAHGPSAEPTLPIATLPPPTALSSPPAAPQPTAARLLLESSGATHLVSVKDIDWVEAQDYYAVVHAGDQAIWTKRSMDDLSADLDPGTFARIHRSTLVNIDRIDRIEKDEGGQPVVVLRSGVRRRFSQARWQDFRRHLSRRD